MVDVKGKQKERCQPRSGGRKQVEGTAGFVCKACEGGAVLERESRNQIW